YEGSAPGLLRRAAAGTGRRACRCPARPPRRRLLALAGHPVRRSRGGPPGGGDAAGRPCRAHRGGDRGHRAAAAAGRGTAHTCALGTGPIRPLRQRPARLPRTVTGVSEDLKNAHVLVTGATGFVGQAVVEKLLSAYPSTRITVLVRPRGALSAQAR